MSNITVKVVNKELGSAKGFVVRGVCKRAIVVVLKRHICDCSSMTLEDIAVIAAKQAAKHGWKKIFVEPDSYEGEYAEYYNAQSIVNNRVNFMLGTKRSVKSGTLCYIADFKNIYLNKIEFNKFIINPYQT